MNNRRSFLATVGLAGIASGVTVEAAPLAAPDGELDIFQAAFKGDIPRATELAKLNPAIAYLRSPDGRTPLHFAAAGGHADMVFFLTQKAADLSAGPESPLIAAIDFPDQAAAFDTASALLINGSDPNAKRADGKTALEIAISRGYGDIVALLVHRGAEVSNGGAKIERVYFGKRYSFDVEGRPYTRENLDGLPQDFINEFARLAHFDVERVKHLHKLAPSLVHARATWDESAIEAASHMGLVPLARYLADHGAPVSTCTATLLGLRERVAALVSSDAACVRERGAHDIALLAYTALGDQRADIAELLLAAGAGVHEKALGNVTALHLAASKGYLELAEVLLARGADVNEPGRVTPLAAAIRGKQEKMADFLKSRGGRG
jgi:ankyrin repeat protein